MNWVDTAILVLIGLSILVGVWRGFLREVVSILVWVAAAWVAVRYSGIAAEALAGWIEMPSARSIIAFVALFVVVLMIGGLITWLLGKLVESTGLSGTDRLLGMVFGALRGVVLVTIVVMIAEFTPFPNDPWWRQSYLLPYFETAASEVAELLPEEFNQRLPAPGVVPEEAPATGREGL